MPLNVMSGGPDTIEIMPENKLLTVAELADHLRVSRKTIYNWRALGRGPAPTYLGRLLRFRMADVEAFIDGENPSQ